MKTTTHFKYIEWRNPEGLHEDTAISISDVSFLKDELNFLNDLVAQNTVELLFDASVGKSQEFQKELYQLTNRADKLSEKLNSHRNMLQILMDDIDVPDENKVYKNVHYKLMMDVIDFHADVKKIKKQVFATLSKVIKKSKQKKLS